MNTFFKNLSSLLASLGLAGQNFERSYQAHEVELFLLHINAELDLNITTPQAMEMLKRLKVEQKGSVTLNAQFCDCRHTVTLRSTRVEDGYTLRIESSSMPLNDVINAELKDFNPASALDNMEFARAA